MNKERIFEVAEEHFFAKRYTDVKLDNIAQSLWIRKPSLYYYFFDKKDLFIQTLRYSMNKYLDELKKVSKKDDLYEFIKWYLVYPSENKNLFAVAFQKWYCIDEDVNSTIFSWKMIVEKTINQFLSDFGWAPVKKYLIINMLEKLAQDNCVDWYCLMYDIDSIYSQIKKFLEV